jgi:hypothetical protein
MSFSRCSASARKRERKAVTSRVNPGSAPHFLKGRGIGLAKSGPGRARLAGMEQVRARSDRTLASLHRTSPRRRGWLFHDRRLDRERAARLLRALKLLKLREIKLFLLQVGSQFGHRRPDEEHDQREDRERAIHLKEQRYHPGTRFASPPAPPKGKIIVHPAPANMFDVALISFRLHLAVRNVN